MKTFLGHLDYCSHASLANCHTKLVQDRCTGSISFSCISNDNLRISTIPFGFWQTKWRQRRSRSSNIIIAITPFWKSSKIILVTKKIVKTYQDLWPYLIQKCIEIQLLLRLDLIIFLIRWKLQIKLRRAKLKMNFEPSNCWKIKNVKFIKKNREIVAPVWIQRS